MEPGLLIFALLSQAPAVQAVVGTAIYPVVAPEGQARPYICYQLISQNGQATMSCALDDTARVQLSLFADTYAQLAQLSAACRQVLAGYRAGSVLIDFDGLIDHHDDRALCLYRTQDYLLEVPAP